MMRPIGQDAEIIVARCRAAVARLRCAELGIEEVAITLKAGRISAPGAVAWLRANDVADLVLNEEPTK
jgi:hypothetical protein